MEQRKGFFSRLADLWRAFWGIKLRNAEARNAELVYHNAVTKRTHQYEKLKDAVSRLVYLRNRVEAALHGRRGDLALVEAALVRAAHMDDDHRALQLIRKQLGLQAEIERLEGEFERLMTQADESKHSLAEVSKSIKQLKNERDEMLARKQHAMARMEINSALQATLGDTSSTDQALENVRESIFRLEGQADLQEEGYVATDDISIRVLRREAADDADLERLDALKIKLGKKLLPEAEERTSASDFTEVHREVAVEVTQ